MLGKRVLWGALLDMLKYWARSVAATSQERGWQGAFAGHCWVVSEFGMTAPAKEPLLEVSTMESLIAGIGLVDQSRNGGRAPPDVFLDGIPQLVGFHGPIVMARKPAGNRDQRNRGLSSSKANWYRRRTPAAG